MCCKALGGCQGRRGAFAPDTFGADKHIDGILIASKGVNVGFSFGAIS